MSKHNKHFFIHQTRIPAPADLLWQMVSHSSVFERTAPQWVKQNVVTQAAELKEGEVASCRIASGPLSGKWKAMVSVLKPGFLIGFSLTSPWGDTWALWTKCLPGDSKAECILEDRVEYPTRPLAGKTRKRIQLALRQWAHYRHTTIQHDLHLFLKMGLLRPQKIAIAGGSGLLGQQLQLLLKLRGHSPFILSTQQDSGHAYWDPVKGILDSELLEGIDTVINLSGFPVACRWSKKNRMRIEQSRIQSSHLLVKTLCRLNQPPKRMIQASGTGYYGFDNRYHQTENAARGEGFLAKLCEDWESELQSLQQNSIRWLAVRLGVVISARGGALKKMLPPFRMGMGGRLGSGKQGFPWISLDDTAALFCYLAEQEDAQGVFNGCAPDPLTQVMFTKSLSHVLRRPALLPVPGFVLKTMFGKMANELLLGGVHAVPERTLNTGYEFRHAKIEDALRATLGNLE